MKSLLIFLLVLFPVAIVSAQHKHWTTPDQLVVQYAGSIGYVSGGVAYKIFKDRARTSFHYGYVPRAVGGPLNIFAGKFFFIPNTYKLSRNAVLNPFDVGLMVSYHLGKTFRSRWPDQQYPRNYYWWQTSFRFHLNLQSSVTWKLRDHTKFKYITGYIELNSNELYLISYFQNMHGLSPKDVIMLGVGTRLQF